MKTIFAVLVIIGLALSTHQHLKVNSNEQTTQLIQESDSLIDFVRDEGATFSGTKYGWSGAYNLPAADNVSSKYAYAKGSCYHSVNNRQAHWTVTFAEPAVIDHLTLLNRSDCCSGRLNHFEILLDGKVCYSQDAAVGSGELLTIDSCKGVASSATVRFASDKPNHQNYLTICGFSAFGQFYEKDKPVPQIDFVREEGAKFSGTQYGWQGAYNLPAADNVSSKYGYANGSCYHSVKDNNAWWTVTFAEPAVIDYLSILNRSDCCSGRLNNFEVLLDDRVCYSQVAAVGSGEQLTLNSCNGVASRATVRFAANKPTTNQDYLTICGFEAIGQFYQKDAPVPEIDFARDEGVTFTGTQYGWSGAYNLPAVENVSSKYAYAKGSCYHSVNNRQAFWTVTFAEPAVIDYLTILNRSDCCSGRLNHFEVLLDDEVCYSQDAAVGSGELLRLESCSGVASSATIRFAADKPNHQNYLTICGFEAIGRFYQKDAPIPIIDLVRDEGVTFAGTQYGWQGAYNLPASKNVSSKYGYANGSCYHSVKDNNASWTVTFAKPADVHYLTLLNRSDCCSGRLNNFEVLLDGKVCYSQVGAVGSGEELVMNSCYGVASSATVRFAANKPVTSQDYLTICGFSAIGSYAKYCPN